MHHFTDGSDKQRGLSSDCETMRDVSQPPTRVLAHDMHGQCLSSDQTRLGTRGLANHVGVLAGKRDDASKWPEDDDASM